MISLGWPGGSPENTALIVAIVFGAYLASLWLAALIWTVRDIHSRTRDWVMQFVYVLLVVVFNFPGLILYIVLRPTRTLEEDFERRLEEQTLLHELRGVFQCPECDAHVEPDYLVCPRCATALRDACAQCDRPIEAGWQACPWCGEPLSPAPDPAPAAAGREPAPAAADPDPPELSEQPAAQEG